MTILLHTPTNARVEILDVYEAGGVVLATVRALSGKPFVAGLLWPRRTEFAIVEARSLRALPLAFDLSALVFEEVRCETL